MGRVESPTACEPNYHARTRNKNVIGRDTPPREDPRMQTFNIAYAIGVAATLRFATSPSKKNAIFCFLPPHASRSWLTRPRDYREKNSVYFTMSLVVIQ